MAQVYAFTDQNGETRLFAEIHPDPAGTPFNGGTITQPLTIDAVGADTSATVQVLDVPRPSWGGNDPLVLLVAKDGAGNANTSLDISAEGTGHANIVVSDDSGSGSAQLDSQQGIAYFAPSDGVQVFAVTATTLGFYRHAPVAQQTGVAVTIAAVHAALVNLGLITA